MGESGIFPFKVRPIIKGALQFGNRARLNLDVVSVAEALVPSIRILVVRIVILVLQQRVKSLSRPAFRMH